MLPGNSTVDLIINDDNNKNYDSTVPVPTKVISCLIRFSLTTNLAQKKSHSPSVLICFTHFTTSQFPNMTKGGVVNE